MKTLLLALLTLAAPAAFAHDAERLAPLQELTLAGGKTIIVNEAKLTVYTFDNDTGRESTCYDGCAKAWPPVLIDAAKQVSAPLSTTVRKDGKVQLAVNGHPVYLFQGDKKAGDTNGDGLGGIWHVIED